MKDGPFFFNFLFFLDALPQHLQERVLVDHGHTQR